MAWLPVDGTGLDRFTRHGAMGAHAAELIRDGLGAATRPEYDRAFRIFARLMQQHHPQWWRPTSREVAMCEDSLAIYLAFLHRGRSPGVLGRDLPKYLSALADRAWRSCGWVPAKGPTGNWCKTLRNLIDGARRSDPARVKKVPITPGLLRALLVDGEPALGEATRHDNVCCFAALTIGLTGMLRPQDYLSPSQSLPTDEYQRGIRYGDASEHPAGFYLRTSKGERGSRLGRGHQTHLHEFPTSPICAAKWLRRWMGLRRGWYREVDPHAPLFQLASGRYLTPSYLVAALRRGLVGAEARGRIIPGLPRPSLHGLRVAACTVAWEADVPLNVLQIEMRWRTLGFRRAYIDPERSKLVQEAINAPQ